MKEACSQSQSRPLPFHCLPPLVSWAAHLLTLVEAFDLRIFASSRTEDERYEALMQALSGLFCASLGQALTNTFTTRPYVPHLSDAYSRYRIQVGAFWELVAFSSVCCDVKLIDLLLFCNSSYTLPHHFSAFWIVYRKPHAFPQASPLQRSLRSRIPAQTSSSVWFQLA